MKHYTDFIKKQDCPMTTLIFINFIKEHLADKKINLRMDSLLKCVCKEINIVALI